jgi:hypothetical protein
MASNYGPTAFQANAFQVHPLAFQIDANIEEAPVTGNLTAESPAANSWGVEASQVKAWNAGTPVANSWVTESIANQTWTPEDEPGP